MKMGTKCHATDTNPCERRETLKLTKHDRQMRQKEHKVHEVAFTLEN
jgi:hypothetical protein